MAGAETVVSFSIGGLRDLLVEEGEYLNALKSPVDELREKLTSMESWLEYAEARRDERTKEVVDLADKLIDSIESYVVLRVSSKNIITSFRERMLRRKVSSDIQEITTKITDLVKGLSETIKVGGDSASSSLGKAYKVQDLSYLNEDDFVGREKDTENLVNYLINDDQIRIISILGMGGLGKTTLARKVYKDKRVVSHFEGFAFVCVSQQCQADAISRHILQQLAPEKKEEEIKSMSETEVIEQLQIVYRKKSCLVVIDDLWSVDDWKSLSRGLPDGDMNSKIIITTRNQDVAEVGLCYKPDCLTEEEGWKLLQNKIFLPRKEFTDSRVGQRMEELGREMIGWCRGIPLAVLVLRGVLVTKATLHEWERFYESRTREVEHEQLYGEVKKELLFSYNELPYQLRPCFLYLGYFLEDEEIEAEKLYMLWDAEGMLLSKDRKDGETMMDVAERYLGELVGRSMVEAEFDTSRRLKSCRLHDLMRELCLSIVRKEKFLKVHDYHTQETINIVLDISCLRDDTTTPRHAFYFSDDSNFSVPIEQEAAQNVRSLRFIRGNLEKSSSLKNIKFVRVLDFYNVDEVKKNLMKETIHLKYLSFKSCYIDFTLPILLAGDFRYLQSLDLRILNITKFDIPNVLLRKLKRLRHLFLPIWYKVTPELSRLRLEGMRELETLVNFDSRCEMKDVIQVAKLRRFEGHILISSKDDVEDWKGLIGYMKKVDLDSSQRSSLKISLDGPMMINDLNEQLEGCEGIIREASIVGLRGNLLQIFDFTPLLSILLMENICFEEDPMPTLEKLQNLEELRLGNVELKGKEMTCSTMGFPQLKYLEIRKMKNLEKWRVEEGAMRNLSSLSMTNICLEEDPMPTLEKLQSLKYLILGNVELKGNEMICSTMGFPQLKYLGIRMMKNLEKWRVEEGAMRNLSSLRIYECSKLEMLPDGLKYLADLKNLYIYFMPEEFKKRIRVVDGGEEGADFYKIRHVPEVNIT